jgi:hypothetical protein
MGVFQTFAIKASHITYGLGIEAGVDSSSVGMTG